MGRLSRERMRRTVALFLAVMYGIGAPLAAIGEFRGGFLSERLDLPPTLIYFTSAVQLLCAVGVLLRPVATWAAALLTVTTIGAIGAHVRVGEPLRSVTAVVFTVVQVWFGWVSRVGGPAGAEQGADG